MSFCLTNAPIFYSRNDEDHASHVTIVHNALKDKKWYDMFSKCVFLLKYVAFLVHIVSGDGIRVDTQKIEVVQICPRPKSLADITIFLGLASYFGRFI